jgi:hypothetical protein
MPPPDVAFWPIAEHSVGRGSVCNRRRHERISQIKPRPGHKAPCRPRVANRLELQEQVTELAAQQAAMSDVLRSIANSPHELEPVFDTITANATRLCGAAVGALMIYLRGTRLSPCCANMSFGLMVPKMVIGYFSDYRDQSRER